MSQKRGIIHPKSWSFLEFSSGAMFNDKPLLFDFGFAVCPYTPQAPVDFSYNNLSKHQDAISRL
ncbi:MAG: hypothetical protein HWQ38_30870 [Nostoc sp. NMS7]|uniref:hypothetical protein n=1 Tax=Nostoc sp. NMS7 TaxID=2815391 RepID=UPI0025FDFC30|nr:hypothetical protein [Nostoc sp. NMS7]MBN3950633.1 hypothetical protein [Nostoc sp. NMS7]